MLIDVRFVPGLKRNLISLGTLDELGFCYKAQKGKLYVYKDDNLILSGTKRNSLYVLDGCYHTTARMDSALVSKFDITELWHLRLGHISQRGIQVLDQQGLLGKVTVKPLDFCEACVLGKQHIMSFPKGTHMAKACLE